MSAARPGPKLDELLPSTPYVLAYSLPVLFVSVLLAFAGTFLTLDRTRTFPPRYDTLPGAYEKKSGRKVSWLLEGGVGGLGIGYAFGVHFSTFLALLIPNVSSSASLSPKSFLAVWVLSAIVTTLLAGRWKYCALLFAGITGGATMALSLSVVLHPTLLSRVILTSVLVPILAVLALLPLAHVQHGAMRLATSATGAFGIVLAIALMAKVPAWADVWERLWLSDGLAWGTQKERGLSATWVFFWALGGACDWFLRRRFGENPDEKWDDYLANFSAGLPHSADRAGTFEPLSYSFWGRIFGNKRRVSTPLAESIRFPRDEDLKPKSTPHSFADGSAQTTLSGDPYKFERSVDILKKQGRLKVQAKSGRRREGVKFRPLGDTSGESGESDDDDVKSPLSSDAVRPWLMGKPSISSMGSGSDTLNEEDEGSAKGGIDPEAERIRLKRVKAGLGRSGRGLDEESDGEGKEIPDYSDYEEDVTAHAKRVQRRVSRDAPGWSPEFLDRYRSGSGPLSRTDSTSPSRRSGARANLTAALPVPATPSLIKAMERIAVAQQAAFGPVVSREGVLKASEPVGEGVNGLPTVAEPNAADAKKEAPQTGARWDGFWREVREKAKER